MKVYYALAILVHLLAAFLSRDKNKSAFLLYLMKNLLINETVKDPALFWYWSRMKQRPRVSPISTNFFREVKPGPHMNSCEDRATNPNTKTPK